MERYARASPSGKALAFQANTRRFESDRPLERPSAQTPSREGVVFFLNVSKIPSE